MLAEQTAIILIGYQNDYFAADGILRGVVEVPTRVDEVLAQTLTLIRAVQGTDVTIISTPIVLSDDYRAMASPVGILHSMKEVGAFREGSHGAQTIPEFAEFGARILYLSGKVGFNAFANTNLYATLEQRQIKNVLLCGIVTSLCVDSTGRAAYERGLNVTVISDCTSGRTDSEQQFYCANIFPLYGRAIAVAAALEELGYRQA
jgi:nicotinamidase-related amidase